MAAVSLQDAAKRETQRDDKRQAERVGHQVTAHRHRVEQDGIKKQRHAELPSAARSSMWHHTDASRGRANDASNRTTLKTCAALTRGTLTC
ncbi:Hypothetical protein SMAX5B_006866 [Scophthalmus maximus]|uniref:Uncharacterized protein n=1 Tax=Scophthalmus maximus TaxID=52904 RepID=A0A2U9CEY6_SCOMX|nr:Hypothetical protein SMAX5B_006866 [Scophthalmus maximus]KAF0031800.1 hypothetical protein F2P81_016355 [Scophthalmus maximus]